MDTGLRCNCAVSSCLVGISYVVLRRVLRSSSKDMMDHCAPVHFGDSSTGSWKCGGIDTLEVRRTRMLFMHNIDS